MRVSDFYFDLPKEAIAHAPVFPRDSAKLLEVKHGVFNDYHVRDLPDLLRAGDVMVFNDTKVIPARLLGKRGEASIEVTLHKQVAEGIWKAFARPAKRLKEGQSIIFAEDFSAEVQQKGDEGEITLGFDRTGPDFWEKLHRYGVMPLPPYIQRDKKGLEEDRSNYQTIYAKKEGAVAAPTAGLHFTDSLFKALDEKSIQRVFVTLHVGAGTFLPVKVENVEDHQMHSEIFSLSEETASIINQAKRNGGRLIAVGTTSMRVLETLADEEGRVHAASGETDIFIVPGYKFKAVDMLLTNFHLPCSTLFMLVCAFAGKETMTEAYKHAIASAYRFYSYGDASLLYHDNRI